MRPRQAAIRLALFVAWFGHTSPAQAEPQVNGALTAGVAGVGDRGAIWSQTTTHLGLRGDLLFGRSGPADRGFGPYLEVGTYGFSNVHAGGGLSALFPLRPRVPLVVSLGGYGRAAHGSGVEPGITVQAFLGHRSFNYHANYELTAGLMTALRVGVGGGNDTAFLVGAQIDLGLLTAPFVFAYELLRGASSETAAIR